jgi:glycosyltransferase involved in cell wall biosynthesis
MTLSVVIPVRNDPTGLTRLLKQLLQLQIAERILVCDDASDPPCRPADLGFDEAAAGICYLRSSDHRGAGHARNMGIAALDTDHVLFFDSDDLLCDAVVDLLRDLEGKAFDFCLFRHIDSRQRSRGTLGPMDSDQQLWQSAGLQAVTPQQISADQVEQMAMIAAYPWNKIYRSGFLQEHNIRCTEIMVHNDLELHWTSFLKAKHIYASAALCCEHFVAPEGGRLTNRRDRERLEVFQALSALHQVLRETAQAPRFVLPMTTFYLRLFDWVQLTLEEHYHAEFQHRIAAFLLANHDLATMTLIADRAPDLAHRINGHIRRGWS